MSNKIDRSGFAEYIDQNICLKRADGECTIVGVPRRDASIRVTVVLMCVERSLELSDEQKSGKKDQYAFQKHLPLAVQQTISSMYSVLFRLKDKELPVKIRMAVKITKSSIIPSRIGRTLIRQFQGTIGHHPTNG